MDLRNKKKSKTSHESDELLGGHDVAGSHDDERGRPLAVDVVRSADDGRVGHGRVRQQMFLDSRRHHLVDESYFFISNRILQWRLLT